MKNAARSNEEGNPRFRGTTKGLDLHHYQARDVLRVVGVSQGLMTQWIERGHVIPTIPASGHGTRNKFDELCICQILLFKVLNEAGFKLNESSRLAFQIAIKGHFAWALRKIGDIEHKSSKGELNWLSEEADLPQIIAVFSRNNDGEIETNLVINQEDFNMLFHKVRQSKITIMPNLTEIAEMVYREL